MDGEEGNEGGEEDGAERDRRVAGGKQKCKKKTNGKQKKQSERKNGRLEAG